MGKTRKGRCGGGLCTDGVGKPFLWWMVRVRVRVRVREGRDTFATEVECRMLSATAVLIDGLVFFSFLFFSLF